MFRPTRVAAAMPAQDIERAVSFYADKLGLKPVAETAGEIRYEVAGNEFFLFPSSGVASGTHTQLGFDVDDLVEAVRTLREGGVVFEEYNMPGFKSIDGIVDLHGERGAWFKDSEGNLIGIGQRIR